MLANILLVFIFWTLPCLIFFIAPFGGHISDDLAAVIFGTNFAIYAPVIFWFFVAKRGGVERGKILNPYINLNIQILILILNIYILSTVGFTLGILDDSIRTTIYANAGIFWSLLVALYSISYVLIGSALGRFTLSKSTIILAILNFAIFFSYGMKAGIVQIILSYLAGWLAYKDSSSKTAIFKKILYVSITVLFGFWAINSLRAEMSISLFDFINLIYLYIAPNFQNFSNILGVSYEYEYFLGGIFGGIYKLTIPGYYDPLNLVSLNYLEHQTWNVWSYLATFYVSGGLFEVYFGSLLIGVYVTTSLIWYRKRSSILASVNMSQNFLLLLFLHNQFYHSSFAPYLAVGLTWLISPFFYKKQVKLYNA